MKTRSGTQLPTRGRWATANKKRRPWAITSHRPLHLVSQTVCEPIIVAVIVKDDSATITARDDVADRTGESQTRRPGHPEGPTNEGEHTNARLSTPLKTENQV